MSESDKKKARKDRVIEKMRTTGKRLKKKLELTTRESRVGKKCTVRVETKC